MDGFCARPAVDREAAFLRASEVLGLSAAAVEKDFWVCFALRAVDRLAVGRHLAFKGGTSLSKGYALIERFSEDLDLVIDREFLGFGGAQAPEAATTRRGRSRRVEELQAASSRYVHGELLPALRSHLQSLAEAGLVVRVTLDPDEVDRQAILVEYASVVGEPGYVRPVVKLEFGARSALEPSEDRIVTPYLSRLESLGLVSHEVTMRVVAPERTFLDKVALLHEEGYRDGGPRPRLARHYYDLHCMDRRGIAHRALRAPGLFEAVVDHRRLYFRGAAEAQSTLVRGQVRLLPTPERVPAWRADFEAMRDTMFFGDVPTFERILADLGDLEVRINQPLPDASGT